MQSTKVDGVAVLFDPAERDAAEIIRAACARSLPLIEANWGLAAPADCRVYVMTGWREFIFHAAPWTWRIALRVTQPLWTPRVKRLWPVAGGWAQRFGRRQTVGIKPPRLFRAADRQIGERVFIPTDDIDEKVWRTTCHELTHACAAHLRLPMWLNEGLAMITVDQFAGTPTVRPETLDLLGRADEASQPAGYRRLSPQDEDALVRNVVRGYWVTRYLHETRPALLRELLARRRSHRALEADVAAALGLAPATFWAQIDGLVTAHFRGVSDVH